MEKRTNSVEPLSNGRGTTNLKQLYMSYLKITCPDWTEERILSEVEQVFREQRLENSQRRQTAFRERITRKLDVMTRHPNDWYLHENGNSNQ